MTKATKEAAEPPPDWADPYDIFIQKKESEEHITENDVEEMLQNVLLGRSRLKMPSKKAIKWLAYILDGHYDMQHPGPPRTSNAIKAAIAAYEGSPAWEAYDELVLALPGFIEAFAALCPSETRTPFMENIKREMELLVGLNRALSAAYSIFNPTRRLKPIHWKWDSSTDQIAHCFRLAVASTNPRARLGTTERGPLVRFVAAAVERVYGQHVTISAVAKRLQRAKRARQKGGQMDVL